MVEGESQYDMFAWDVARFGEWADEAFTKAKVGDQYAHRFSIHFPNEERMVGRPVRVRPIQGMQSDMGAKFGLNYGWEHPLYFDADVRKRRVHTPALVGQRGARMSDVAGQRRYHRHFQFCQIPRHGAGGL